MAEIIAMTGAQATRLPGWTDHTNLRRRRQVGSRFPQLLPG